MVNNTKKNSELLKTLVCLLIMIVLVETILLFIKTKNRLSETTDIRSTPIATLFPTYSTQNQFSDVEELSSNIIPNGTIVFGARIRSSADPHGEYKFYIMNKNINPLQSIGSFTGSSAWSPDGTKLAIGCENIDQVCILDMLTLGIQPFFPKKVPANSENTELIIKRIDLPDECSNLLLQDIGVTSISWSRDGNELAILCNNQKISTSQQKTKVCIITISGEGVCWSDIDSESVQKIAYSPSEDVFVLSRNGYIEIAETNGKTIQILTKGINPAWSPDGNSIAFASYFDDTARNGIGLIDKEGKVQRWLYLQPVGKGIEEFFCQMCDSRNQGRISWSPDGKYLVFSATYLSDYRTYLFRLNLLTGEIVILDWNGLYTYTSDPNWGSLDFK